MSLTFFKCLEKFLKVYLIANEKGKREIANICEKIIPFWVDYAVTFGEQIYTLKSITLRLSGNSERPA